MSKPAGRDDIAAALSVGLSLSLDTGKNIVRALFGSGGSGQPDGGREPGLIERLLKDGGEVNIRGFGKFTRVEYKGGARKIGDRDVISRAKSKLSFTAGQSTDIIK